MPGPVDASLFGEAGLEDATKAPKESSWDILDEPLNLTTRVLV